MTNLDGVFAGGDIKRGATQIVWTIAEGRKMAAGIDKYLPHCSLVFEIFSAGAVPSSRRFE